MKENPGVRQRLLQAALNRFLHDDYHQVSTREIAAQAQANVSMIRYYFGSKRGLYEEMLREQLTPLLDVLDGSLLSGTDGFASYFKLYYDTMSSKPEFPRLILKVLALNHGPGRHFIQQLLERGRLRGARQVEALKRSGKLASDVDADILRLAFVSLAMTPILLKDIFEEQMEIVMDDEFTARLAQFNGMLFAAGLAPQAEEGGAP